MIAEPPGPHGRLRTMAPKRLLVECFAESVPPENTFDAEDAEFFVFLRELGGLGGDRRCLSRLDQRVRVTKTQRRGVAQTKLSARSMLPEPL
jgi:hypothetical protein